MRQELGTVKISQPMPATKLRRAPARRDTYHHGDLRAALLDAALELVRDQGPSAVSLREVARRAGVSHAAPAHHFGDKAGLLTALAAQGFERFLAAQQAAAERGGHDPGKRLAWTGRAYVMFAAEQTEYFSLMFRPELLRMDDPAFKQASDAAFAFLLEGLRKASLDAPDEDTLVLRATAAWAQVHGLAQLWLGGSLRQYLHVEDLDGLVQRILCLP